MMFDFTLPIAKSFDLIDGENGTAHVYGYPPSPPPTNVAEDSCQQCQKTLVTLVLDDGSLLKECRLCGCNPVGFTGTLTSEEHSYFRSFMDWHQMKKKEMTANFLASKSGEGEVKRKRGRPPGSKNTIAKPEPTTRRLRSKNVVEKNNDGGFF